MSSSRFQSEPGPLEQVSSPAPEGNDGYGEAADGRLGISDVKSHFGRSRSKPCTPIWHATSALQTQRRAEHHCDHGPPRSRLEVGGATVMPAFNTVEFVEQGDHLESSVTVVHGQVRHSVAS